MPSYRQGSKLRPPHSRTRLGRRRPACARCQTCAVPHAPRCARSDAAAAAQSSQVATPCLPTGPSACAVRPLNMRTHALPLAIRGSAVDAYLAGATQHLDLRISGAQYPLREGAPNMNGRWLSYSCPASAVVVRAHPVYALFRVFHPSYPVIGSRTVLCAGGLSRDLISSFVWVESAALLSAPPPERSTCAHTPHCAFSATCNPWIYRLSLQPALTRREPLSISGVRYPLRTEAPSMSGRRSTVGGSRIAVRPPLWYASMLRMRPPGSPVGDSCTALCAGGLSRDLVSCFVLMWRVQPTFDPRPPPPRPPRLRQVRAGSVPSGAGSAALLVGSVSDGRVSMDGIPAPFVRADRGISERPCARAGPCPLNAIALCTRHSLAHDRQIRSHLERGWRLHVRWPPGRRRSGVRCVWRRAPTL